MKAAQAAADTNAGDFITPAFWCLRLSDELYLNRAIPGESAGFANTACSRQSFTQCRHVPQRLDGTPPRSVAFVYRGWNTGPTMTLEEVRCFLVVVLPGFGQLLNDIGVVDCYDVGVLRRRMMMVDLSSELLQ